MPSHTNERPRNPDYLMRAVRRIFGEACLRCGIDRPRAEMAHIRNWPRTRAKAAAQTGPLPPRFAHVIREHSRGLFHDLGNVLPLCPNCHTLFDGPYDEVDEAQIRALRDEAVRQPEVLVRVIDFIRAELRGRPNRCTHKDDDGGRKHTHRTDIMALGAPLRWVTDGYASGLDLGAPEFVIKGIDGSHHHVALDQGMLDLCVADIRDCTQPPGK